MFDIEPQITSSNVFFCLSISKRSVFRNEFGEFFTTTFSDERGFTIMLISEPYESGRKKEAPFLVEICFT
ncbi:MAG: hypothetical protein PHP13_00655 [Methanomicrobium sp.]|nr:hypothetical protein [Methanomicrobium sp.]